jgi:hypothetical protein
MLAGVMLDVMFPERFQSIAQDILLIQLQPVDSNGDNYQFKFATIFSRTYSGSSYDILGHIRSLKKFNPFMTSFGLCHVALDRMDAMSGCRKEVTDGLGEEIDLR